MGPRGSNLIFPETGGEDREESERELDSANALRDVV